MEVECAYFSELNSEEIFHRLKRKVEQNEKLADEELMEFIIYPLSYRTKEEKQAAKTAYRKVVIRMIQKDYSTEEISSLVSAYSQDDIEELRRELQAEKN